MLFTQKAVFIALVCLMIYKKINLMIMKILISGGNDHNEYKCSVIENFGW